MGDIRITGREGLLELRRLGLFCSARCPGNLILLAYDFVLKLDDPNRAVIGGFHTDTEKECLRLLLRGEQPVIICPARSTETLRLPAQWRQRIAKGQVLLLSPFGDGQPRVTEDKASKRNDFVASLADEILVVHAAPGSKTLALCERVLDSGKPVLTFDSPHNADLIALGARTINPERRSGSAGLAHDSLLRDH